MFIKDFIISQEIKVTIKYKNWLNFITVNFFKKIKNDFNLILIFL